MLQSGLSTFTSHTWVRGTFVAVGSVTGQVGVFLRGEQKGCYQLMEHIPVICVAAHQAGFVTLSHAMLSFFAPTEPDRRCVLLSAAVRNVPMGKAPKIPCLKMYLVPSEDGFAWRPPLQLLQPRQPHMCVCCKVRLCALLQPAVQFNS